MYTKVNYCLHDFLKGKKYIKRSELKDKAEVNLIMLKSLQFVVNLHSQQQEVQSEKDASLVSPTDAVSPSLLLSPTVPVDDSPVFNMPRSEVFHKFTASHTRLKLYDRFFFFFLVRWLED